MVGANVKAETVTMMDKRKAVENEMDAIIARLTRPGGPGLQGNLVDAQGFPRADLDIPAVRSDRQRLSVLRNDHKEITDAIEKNLIILHSGGFTRGSSQPDRRTGDSEVARPYPRSTPMDIAPSTGITNAEGPSPMDEDAGESNLPFAVFDNVSDGSPAAMDGILMGDQLVKFGSVDGGDDLLMRLAREGQANEGRGLPVVVLRRGERVHLTVTPRRWPGRGLLGYGLLQKCYS
ncbi:hypothetical protein M758_1G208200 [Ceratodon purpureus]|nr:hypothetical protein M758_1G208200 [Ceratodon purpureus]